MLRGSYVENADHAYVARLSLSEGPAPDHVEIDDSQFLFSAHFKKAGADLVLTASGPARCVTRSADIVAPWEVRSGRFAKLK